MTSIILSIGDELVLGQTVDTNSAWMSRQLAAVGCDILAHITVSDAQPAIEQAIRSQIRECDVLLISGGLGPTEDDLTRQALAQVMDQPLELNEKWLEIMGGFFTKLNRVMPESNKIQAMIPRGATMLENTCGTAAGIRATIKGSGFRVQGSGNKDEGGRMKDEARVGEVSDSSFIPHPSSFSIPEPRTLNPEPSCELFVMPGVPKEMKAMFTCDVLPWIKQQAGGAVILSRTLHTFGMGESSIAEKLGDLMKRDRNPSVGTTVSSGLVSLRINARFPSFEQAEAQLESTSQACKDRLGDLIFGQDDETLAQVVASLLLNPEPNILNPEPRTLNPFSVTTAESCTGGLLAKMLTDIPGSSGYFKMGFVTYSNKMKYERLGVTEPTINMYGAVSEPVVDAMARNAKRLAKADFALAISGVAGPTGGTPAKPVGMVCIALAFDRAKDQIETTLRTFNFPGDREMIRDRAAKMALTMLRYHLLGKPLPF